MTQGCGGRLFFDSYYSDDSGYSFDGSYRFFSFFCEQCGEGGCCMGVISKKKKRYECDQEFVWGGGDGGAAACAMDMWGVGEVVHGGDNLCGPLGER